MSYECERLRRAGSLSHRSGGEIGWRQFLSDLSFLAISSINLGFSSASMLSTMLEIASDVLGSLLADSAAAGSAADWGSVVVVGSSSAGEICTTVWDPSIDSRICFQLVHAAAISESRWASPGSLSGAAASVVVAEATAVTDTPAAAAKATPS